MVDANEPQSSVRIELDDESAQELFAPQIHTATASSRAITSESERSRRSLIPVVVGGALLFAALIMAVAPNSGLTAIGTPITTPTTAAPESGEDDVAAVSEPSTEDGESTDAAESTPSTVATPLNPLDRFESGEVSFFPFDVIEAEVGWFALGAGEQDLALYRSLDGLTWTPVTDAELPPGDVLGFDRFGDGFILAVEERSAWSEPEPGAEFFDADYRITFWESPSSVGWEPSSSFEPVEGRGFPYPLQFSQAATALPLIVAPDPEALDPLVDYLSPIMDASQAREICRVSWRSVDGARQYSFFDCDEVELVSVDAADFPEFFDSASNNLELCIDMLRSPAFQRSQVYIDRVGAEPEIISLNGSSGLFGALLESTFVSVSANFAPPPVPGCEGDAETVSSQLQVWSPDGESAEVSLPSAVSANFFQPLVVTPDGGAMLVGQQSVFVSESPFTEWREAPAISGIRSTSNVQLGTLSLAADGSLIMSQRGGFWSFARPDDSEWLEIEVGDRHFGQLMLATEEFAIVRIEGPTSTLVKVPLS